MRLSQEEYRDKVLGCWMGKNIGGTLGAPFEAGEHGQVAVKLIDDRGNELEELLLVRGLEEE